MLADPIWLSRFRRPDLALVSHSIGTNSGVVRQRLSFQCVIAVIWRAMLSAGACV
jgi:hypothetical protein